MMSDLMADNAQAVAWRDQIVASMSTSRTFGRFAGAVIWSDATDQDGELLVPINPAAVAANINANGFPLLLDHDPGAPIGKVIAAEVFTGLAGQTFVAAVLGFYEGGTHPSFRELGLETSSPEPSPDWLPELTEECWIEFATDPRSVESAWVDGLVKEAPIRVERTDLSLNAAGPTNELITLGMLFMTLVWNPFVTSVASEAGKDAYASLRRWLRSVFEKLGERRNPIVEIQSHHDDCRVSFMFRGKDVACHYAAHDALPLAAAQAARLIANLKERGLEPTRLIYEFHHQDAFWFPSYAALSDGRLVTDNNALVAVERLPSGLSLGLRNSDGEALFPKVKMSEAITVIAATPEEHSDVDRARFRELVVEGGEVDETALPTNISNARVLVMLRHNGVVRGVAALKRPQASYRKKVSKKSGFALPVDTYPYELGYVFIEPAMRGRGLSHRLIAEALSHGDDMAIFATARTDNEAMLKALREAGFAAASQSFLGKDDRTIGLLVK